MIRASALTPAAFAAFGQVLQGSGANTERAPFAARVRNGRPHAQLNITYLRVRPESGSVTIAALERHPHSNQTFVPLNGTRQLVVVCSSGRDGMPDLASLRAFVAGGGQAINYDANVWHAPRTAVCEPGEFIMFRWDDGSEDDTEWTQLSTPVTVTFA